VRVILAGGCGWLQLSEDLLYRSHGAGAGLTSGHASAGSWLNGYIYWIDPSLSVST
jgi:hypothetical protein